MTDIDRWENAAPTIGGSLDADAAALAVHVHDGESLLGALPEKRHRDPSQQRVAERILGCCRSVRQRFMAVHSDAVYARLTDDLSTRHRLSELVFAAADTFPGLVPTRGQYAAERRNIQADKDGSEIDQGIFFQGLLRSPSAGRHLMDTMLMPTPTAIAMSEEFSVTGRADLGCVLVERRDHRAHLTVRNQHCLNAEDDRLISAMEVAVDLALLDEGVHVGVLRGDVMTHPRYRGRRVFSAGINLADLHAGQISFVDFLLGRELGYINKLLRGSRPATGTGPTVQKPWVAAVDSFAIGGGMQLLLVFDRVIAASDAYFSLPAAQEGIIPGVANLRLTRFAGSRLARRIVLHGHRVHATDPEAPALCDEVVAPQDVDAAVDRTVKALDSPAVTANRRMITMAEESPDSLREYLAEFAYLQATRLYSEDVLARIDREWSRKAHDATRHREP